MSNLTGFAAACYETNSIRQLEKALKQQYADQVDCAAWDITPIQWRAEISEALAAKLADAEE